MNKNDDWLRGARWSDTEIAIAIPRWRAILEPAYARIVGNVDISRDCVHLTTTDKPIPLAALEAPTQQTIGLVSEKRP